MRRALQVKPGVGPTFVGRGTDCTTMWHGSPGYPIPDEALHLELYQLIGTVAASQKLANSRRRHKELDVLREMFELAEVSRRLISVAVSVRSYLDTGPSFGIDEVLKREVGRFTPDRTRRLKQEKLVLREACNKIIHAIGVDFTPHVKARRSALGRRIRLYGTKGKREWTASLDLYAFVAAACAI